MWLYISSSQPGDPQYNFPAGYRPIGENFSFDLKDSGSLAIGTNGDLGIYTYNIKVMIIVPLFDVT